MRRRAESLDVNKGGPRMAGGQLGQLLPIVKSKWDFMNSHAISPTVAGECYRLAKATAVQEIDTQPARACNAEDKQHLQAWEQLSANVRKSGPH